MSTEISELLETAADLIEKHGHVQGILFAEDGEMCLEGGLYAASYLLENGKELHPDFIGSLPALTASTQRRLDQARGVLVSVLEVDHPSWEPVIRSSYWRRALVRWNDYSARDSQEVLDKLRLAAKKASSDETGESL